MRRAWALLLVLLLVPSPGCFTGRSATHLDAQTPPTATGSDDQVVVEMGPPDKSSKRSDDSTVAEWFVKKNSNVSFGVGTGFYSGGSSVGVGQSIGTSPSGQFLRLTFNADGKLAKWERVRH